MPVLPLRDVVVYPRLFHVLFVGRDKSIRALAESVGATFFSGLAPETIIDLYDKTILLVAQKDADPEDPEADDIYEIGTVATILQLLKFPDGIVKMRVEGVQRARVIQFTRTEEYFEAEIEELKWDPGDERENEVLTRSLVAQFEQYVKLNQQLLSSLSSTVDPSQLADAIASHLLVHIDQKQKLLETGNTQDRLEQLVRRLKEEVNRLQRRTPR